MLQKCSTRECSASPKRRPPRCKRTQLRTTAANTQPRTAAQDSIRVPHALSLHFLPAAECPFARFISISEFLWASCVVGFLKFRMSSLLPSGETGRQRTHRVHDVPRRIENERRRR